MIELCVRREVWGVKGRGRKLDRKKGKAGAKKQGKIGETREGKPGIKRRDRNESIFARPNGLGEHAETVISCG